MLPASPWVCQAGFLAPLQHRRREGRCEGGRRMRLAQGAGALLLPQLLRGPGSVGDLASVAVRGALSALPAMSFLSLSTFYLVLEKKPKS